MTLCSQTSVVPTPPSFHVSTHPPPCSQHPLLPASSAHPEEGGLALTSCLPGNADMDRLASPHLEQSPSSTLLSPPSLFLLSFLSPFPGCLNYVPSQSRKQSDIYRKRDKGGILPLFHSIQGIIFYYFCFSFFFLLCLLLFLPFAAFLPIFIVFCLSIRRQLPFP